MTTRCFPSANFSHVAGAYFGSAKPFINLFRGGQYFLQDYSGFTNPYRGPDGWIKDMPSPPTNGPVKFAIQLDQGGGDKTFIYIRPGIYKLAWNGNATGTIESSYAGVTHSAAAITAEATKPTGYTNCYAIDTGSLTNVDLVVAANNLTSPAVLVDFGLVGGKYPVLYHIDDEADLNAGEIFQRDYARAYEGFGSFRWMDTNRVIYLGWGYDVSYQDNLLGTTGVAPFSLLPVEANRNWAYETPVGVLTQPWTTPWPPTLAGKFAAKTNADCHYCIPFLMSKASHAAWGAAIAAGFAGTTQSIILEPGDELWNYAFPWSTANRAAAYYWAEDIAVVDGAGATIAPIYFTINTTNNTFDAGAVDISARFADGDVLHVMWSGNQRPAPVIPGGTGTTSKHFYVRKFNNFQLRFFPTSVDAINNTNVMTINGPALTWKGYPNGSSDYNIDNFFHLAACGGMECMLSLRAAIVAAGMPADRVKMMMGTFTLTSNANKAALYYVDPRTGQQCKNLLNYWAPAPYTDTAIGGVITAADLEFRTDNPSVTTDAWFNQAYENGSTGPAAKMIEHQNMLDADAPNVKLSTYEGGWLREDKFLERFTFTARIGNALTSSTNPSAKMANGEQILFKYQLPYDTLNDTYESRRPFIRFKAGDPLSMYLFATGGTEAGGAMAVGADTGTGAHVIAASPGLPIKFDTFTRVKAQADLIRNFTQTQPGLAAFQAIWHKIYKNKAAHCCIFFDFQNDLLKSPLSNSPFQMSPQHEWMKTTSTAAKRYKAKVLLGTR